MKNRHPGPILKLNRIKQDYTLEYVSKKSGISISKLSDFENKKVVLSSHELWELYRIIDLDYKADANMDIYVEEQFKLLYHHIVYQESLECFKECANWSEAIQMTLSYPKYLLMELLYHLYAKQEYAYEECFVLLINHLDYLEDYQIPILYDALGVYYKNNDDQEEALKWFLKAAQMQINDTVTSIVYYHIAKPLLYLGHAREAAMYLEKAIDLFAKELNFKRMTKTSDTLGVCYDALCDYPKAQNIYLKSIDVFKKMNLTLNLNITYNNLVWSCILSNSYQDVLTYGKEALEIEKNQGAICFYMAYASSKLGHKEDAKRLIRMAKQNMDEENKYMRSMIDTFYTLLSENKSYELKGKKLLKTYKEAKKCGDSQVMIFVLDMLVAHYESQNDYVNQVYYLKEQIAIYKKRR